MKRKISVLLALVIMLAGVGVAAYPALSDYISQKNGSYAIQSMNTQLSALQWESLEEQRRLAGAYNAALTDGASNVKAMVSEYEQIMDFGGGMMGYIEIPKIDVSLPIYHGVSEEVLGKGVGHLPESAFPIGGEGNHTVLSGHTGLPSAVLFSDLTELELGDLFYITALEEALTYQVDQIRVVLPGEIQELTPTAGEDYCTLVTCTPYGINSHRLLVRGVRIEPETAESGTQVQEQTQIDNGIPGILIMAAAAAALILMVILVLLFRKSG